MIFWKRTIRTTSIPKIRKIHSGVWKLSEKNSHNCQFWPKNGLKWTKFRHIKISPAHRVLFSKRWSSEQLPYQKQDPVWLVPPKESKFKEVKKGRKICNYFWKIEAKNSQKGRNLVENGQILNIFEFPRHAEYDFFKEDHKNNFHTKKLGRFIAVFGRFR